MQSHADVEGIPGDNFRLIELQIGVLETAVTQAKTEGIERLLGQVAICASFHTVILERRQLIERLRERDRKFARGRNIAEEHIGHGPAALHAGIPDEENRLHHVLDLAQRNGTAACENKHDSHAMDGKLLDVIHLALWQGNTITVTVHWGEKRFAFFPFEK